jgi:tRNA modification GTPase
VAVFSTSDTIVAIATPPGRGGIGVVRLSGPSAQTIARALITHDGPLEPRHATLTRVRADDLVDRAVVTFFSAPHSYTGDDVVEVSAHGSPVVLGAIVRSAIAHGARLAEPGEFTLRAFLNGRLDLMQAESIADLIEAVTPLQARTAFDQLEGTLTEVIGELDRSLFDLIARLEASVDFPDEGYHFVEPTTLLEALDRLSARAAALLADGRRGRLVREGLQIAIVGKPNVGKSSLFNALVGAGRAIVTDVPGTTRDLVTETIDLGGLRVTLVDTAGIHDTNDIVEAEGVHRTQQAQRVSDLILLVVNQALPLDDADRVVIAQTADSNRLLVANKVDLAPAWRDPNAIGISALSGAGLACLRERIAAALDVDFARDRPAITNIRHIALVERAQDALCRARAAVGDAGGAWSEEFVLADLQDARAALEEVTGRRASEDVLEHIFARFCIGK